MFHSALVDVVCAKPIARRAFWFSGLAPPRSIHTADIYRQLCHNVGHINLQWIWKAIAVPRVWTWTWKVILDCVPTHVFLDNLGILSPLFCSWRRVLKLWSIVWKSGPMLVVSWAIILLGRSGKIGFTLLRLGFTLLRLAYGLTLLRKFVQTVLMYTR